MKVSNTNPVRTEQTGPQLSRTSFTHAACLSPGEREAIQKSVTRSCLLEEEPGEEELSDGEEAAEAME